MKINDLSNLIIKKLISVNTISGKASKTSYRKNREYWALLIKYEGETIYTSGGKTMISNINNVALLPKGSSYNWACTKEGKYIVAEFDADLTLDEVITFAVKSGELFLSRFEELERIWNLKHPFFKVESINIIYDILLKLFKTTAEYKPSKKINKIQPALDYIAENYNKPITNDELANLLGISTVYFRKLFTQYTGTSPISYVQQIRIKKAKEMLKSDYSNISLISETVGYSNIYHFSKAFKQITGYSPTQYAKKGNSKQISI